MHWLEFDSVIYSGDFLLIRLWYDITMEYRKRHLSNNHYSVSSAGRNRISPSAKAALLLSLSRISSQGIIMTGSLD